MKKQSYLLVFLCYCLLYFPFTVAGQSPTNNNGEDDNLLENADEVITICKGESVTLIGWNNVIECPCAVSQQGPTDCFPFPQPNGTWLVDEERICESSCIDIDVQPTKTTLYTHQTPAYQCPAIYDPNAPLGPPPPSYPGGPKLTILVVVEDNCVIQPTSPEDPVDAQIANNQVFIDFPWLEETVDKEGCNIESISIYEKGPFNFLFTHKEGGGTLYFEDGTFYCEQTVSYDCIAAYRLENPETIWTCPQTATSAGEQADTEDQTVDNAPINCSNYQGTIVFEACDDGRIFFFAKTTDGRLLDIYFEQGLNFDYYEGQLIQFDYYPAQFSTPCSIADEAVIVTCIEEIIDDGPDCFCIALYDPVCGVDGNTYGNACEADCAGVAIASPGECTLAYSCEILDVIDLPDDLCGQCISEIAVYSFQGKTYLATIADNTNCADGLTTVVSCLSGNVFCYDGGIAGFSQCNVFFEEAVKLQTIIKEDCGNNCNCPAVVDPVCGADGITYNNECEASCAGVPVAFEGPCDVDPPNCICTQEYDPVCGVDGVTYSNACHAACEGVEIVEPGECAPIGSICDLLARITFPANLCGSCTSEIAIYEYRGETYLVSFPSDTDGLGGACNDFPISVSNCNTGNVFCQSGGNSPDNFCGNFFEEAIKLEVVMAQNCEPTCDCPEIYAPVCGVNGRTYGNRCEADCAGVDIISEGPCISNCICTEEYAPVCGVDGITYSNACHAECAGVDIAAPGECGVGLTCELLNLIDLNTDLCGTCISEIAIYEWNGEIYFVNIASDNNGIGGSCTDFATTVTNCTTGELFCMDGGIAGLQQCEEFFKEAVKTEIIVSRGECNDCNCDDNYAPVCGADGKTYSNRCQADCAGVDIITEEPCVPDCICTLEYAPVCGVDGITYGNRCQADCAGVDIIAEGACEPTCLCPTVALPVCGIDGNTYGNACEAACVGVEVAYEGFCEAIGPCADLGGIDFGDCRAVMGVALVNGTCQTVSGCMEFIVDGVDYSNAFFPTVDICTEACFEPLGHPLFAEYQWLSDYVNPSDCNGETITVYRNGAYNFIYIESENKGVLYFQDGTFYCQDSPGLDCRMAYNLQDIEATWSCDSGKSACDDPLAEDWLLNLLEQDCTGDIFAFDYQGQSAVYIQTLCGCVDDNDKLFTCDGTFLCAIGRIDPTFSCDPFITEYLIKDNLIWSPDCSCECPIFEQPVCGIDGITYASKCEAECAGIEIIGEGICFGVDALAPPCYDVADVDFGLCEAIMGVAIVNGTCQTISGCGEYAIGSVNYEAAFFPTVEICLQTCGSDNDPSNDEGADAEPMNPEEENSDIAGQLFEDYEWLATVLDPVNCQDQAVSEYDLGPYKFIYIYDQKNLGTLYFQDGTFYCQDSDGYNCLDAYKITNAQRIRTWKCGEGLIYNAEVAATERGRDQASFFTNSMTLYPNPTVGKFQLNIKSVSKEPQHLIIYDLYGQQVQQQMIQSIDKNMTIPVDLSELKDGLYMVTLKAKGQAVIQQTIVKTAL